MSYEISYCWYQSLENAHRNELMKYDDGKFQAGFYVHAVFPVMYLVNVIIHLVCTFGCFMFGLIRRKINSNSLFWIDRRWSIKVFKWWIKEHGRLIAYWIVQESMKCNAWGLMLTWSVDDWWLIIKSRPVLFWLKGNLIQSIEIDCNSESNQFQENYPVVQDSTVPSSDKDNFEIKNEYTPILNIPLDWMVIWEK